MSSICHVWYSTLAAPGISLTTWCVLSQLSRDARPTQLYFYSWANPGTWSNFTWLKGHSAPLLWEITSFYFNVSHVVIKKTWKAWAALSMEGCISQKKKKEVASQRIISYAYLFKKPFTKIWICTLTELNNENLKCWLGCCTTWQILQDCPRESWLIKRLGSGMNNHFTHIYAETQ